MMRASMMGRLVSSAPTALNSGCGLCLRDSSAISSDLYYSRRFFQRDFADRQTVLLPASTVPVRQLKPVAREMIGDRGFHTSPIPSINFFTPRDDTTFLGRTLKKLGFTEIPKNILKATGQLLYMKVADDIDYLKFFKTCNLPDTYASWFTVMELHVWLLCTRLMQDGREGQIARNALVNAMWEDNNNKLKFLEGALPSAKRRDLKIMGHQFNAAMIGYDEGLLGNDHVLAGALWQRMLHLETDSPTLLHEHFDSDEKHQKLVQKVKALEMLVIYVRCHYVLLNQLNREQLLRKRIFKFRPFDDSLYDLVAKMEKSQTSKGTLRAEAVLK